MQFRPRPPNSSDVAEITLMSPGGILFPYTDGVYPGSDAEERQHLEAVMPEHYGDSARDICNALMECATKEDDYLRPIGEEDRIDYKTVFIINRS